MNSTDFIRLLKSSEVISGGFNFTSNADASMDMDIKDKKFINCEITGGDFASGVFVNCEFKNALFKNCALVGVNFDRCHFIDCKLVNVDISFSLNNCEIKKLSITREKA